MTDRYAVIGNPIAHSRSPALHRAFAAQCGHEIAYEAILAPPGGFVETVEAFRRAGGRGVNVTLPFKIDAMGYAGRLSERARLAQAVNTLAFDDSGSVGDNTDGCGLVADITRRLGFEIRGRRVLLIGAGGAARGALAPLLEQAPAALMLVNRDPGKALALQQQFARLGAIEAAGLEALRGRQFDLVVNATSAGLHGERLALPAGLFGRDALAYDMVYGSDETAFLLDARELGASRLADGLGMLVEQAAEAFRLWRGVSPETASVYEAMRRALRD